MPTRMEICVDSMRDRVRHLKASYKHSQIVERATPKEEISEFISRSDRGYFIIEGEPGIGKTAFLLGLRADGSILYFFQQGTKYARVLDFLNYVTAELNRRIGREAVDLVWVDDPLDAHDRANRLLFKIAEEFHHESKLWIVADALDEADLGEGGNVRLLQLDLPPNVYVIASSRPDQRILSYLRGRKDVHVFNWRRDEANTATEVEGYVRGRLTGQASASVRDRIAKSADGNFLIAARLIDSWVKGDLALGDLEGRPLSLDAFYGHEWEHRTLSRVKRPELCEDVAILLAAAREPLPTSLITLSFNFHCERRSSVKGRHVESVLRQLSPHFESEGRNRVNLYQPFHPSFARWLRDYYATDLSEAHWALSRAMLESLNKREDPSFEIAARCVCWHLGQYIEMTPDSSNRGQAIRDLNNLLKNESLHGAVETRCGRDIYLDRFLGVAIRCAESIGSLPDILRWGSVYVGCRFEDDRRLAVLNERLSGGKFKEAIEIAESFPEGKKQFACLALVACGASDASDRHVLSEVLDRLAGKPALVFESYVPLIWSLSSRLLALGDEELLSKLMSVVSDDDFRDSVEEYLPRILKSGLHPPMDIHIITPFLEKAARCNDIGFTKDVQDMAEMAIESGIAHEQIADHFLYWLRSLQEEGLRLNARCALLNVFEKRNLPSQTVKVANAILSELVEATPDDFLGGTIIALGAIGSVDKERVPEGFYEQLLDTIGEYKNGGVVKSVALATFCHLLGEPASTSAVMKLIQKIRLEIAGLSLTILKDNVRWQLAVATARRGLFEETLADLASIESPLCSACACLAIAGIALADPRPLPAQLLREISEEVGDDRPLSSELVINLSERILRLTTASASVSVNFTQPDGEVQHLICLQTASLAVASIARDLKESKKRSRLTSDAVAKLILGVLNHIGRTEPNLASFGYGILWCLLSGAESLLEPRRRREAFAAFFDAANILGTFARLEFLCTLVAAVKRGGHESLAEELIGKMPDQMGILRPLEWRAGFMSKCREILSPGQTKRLIERGLAEIEKSPGELDHPSLERFLKAVQKAVSPIDAAKVLRRIHDVSSRAAVFRTRAERTLAALAGCYSDLGLSDELEHLEREAKDRHMPALLSRLAFLLEESDQNVNARKLFIEALTTDFMTCVQLPTKRIRGSLAIGLGQAGSLDQSYNQLLVLGEGASAVLASICEVYEPASDQASTVEEYSLLIEDILSRSTDAGERIAGLSGKAWLEIKTGGPVGAEHVIEEALSMLSEHIETAETYTDCFDAVSSAAFLCPLLEKIGSDSLLRKWLETAILLHRRFAETQIMAHIARRLTPSLVAEKPWYVGAFLDALPDISDESDAECLIGEVARALSLAGAQSLVLGWFEQLIEIVRSKSGPQVLVMIRNVARSLLESGLGADKQRLLGELCASSHEAGGSPQWVAYAMESLVNSVSAGRDSEKDRLILEEILKALPQFSEEPWLLDVKRDLAARFARTGLKGQSMALFEEVLSTLDEMREAPLQNLQKSQVGLVMAECGFAEEAKSVLLEVRITTGPLSSEIKKTVALGLLCADDEETAQCIAEDSGDQTVLACLAGRTLLRSTREMVGIVSQGVKKDGAYARRRAEEQHNLERRMEDCLAEVLVIQDRDTRNDLLSAAATEMSKLPLEEAIRWLHRIPMSHRYETLWKDLSLRNLGETYAIRRIIHSLPSTDVRGRLIRELSGLHLQDMEIPLRIRLSLCSAAAAVDGDLFYGVLCDTLENCRDPEVLLQVATVLDEIEGVKPAREPASEAVAIPGSPQGSQIKVWFRKNTVQVNDHTPITKTLALRVAEYVILQERVHWLWAFVIVQRRRVTNAWASFENDIDREKRKLEKWGFVLKSARRSEEGYARLVQIADHVVSNIVDIKTAYQRARRLYEDGRLPEAVKELSVLTDRREQKYDWHTFTEGYMALCQWIRELGFVGIDENVMIKCRNFLDWYASRLEQGLSKISEYLKGKEFDGHSFSTELQAIHQASVKCAEYKSAFIENVPLKPEEEAYQGFLNVIREAQDRLKAGEPEGQPSGERHGFRKADTGRMGACEIVQDLETRSENLRELVRFGQSYLQQHVERTAGQKTYAGCKIEEVDDMVYWYVSRVLIDLEGIDLLNREGGNRLKALSEFLCSHLAQKLSEATA